MSRPFRTAHLFWLSIQVNDYYINRLMGAVLFTLGCYVMMRCRAFVKLFVDDNMAIGHC